MPDASSSFLSPAAVADAVHAVARQHGFSPDAVEHLWGALARGDGRMAQFDHPEFGGAGQWMQGGMTMVSAMFEGRLQRRVAALCDDLAAVYRQAAAQDVREGPAGASGMPGDGEPAARAPQGAWWPAGLGQPASSGAQDGMRYAWFPESRRLVVESGGRRTVYDTGSHRIGGVSQQQGGVAGLAFASQHGTVDLARLPVVPEHPSGADADAGNPPPASPAAGDRLPAEAPPRVAPAPEAPMRGLPQRHDTAVPPPPASAAAPATPALHDPERILALLEKLADLQARGILSAEEFAAKKTELLGRL
jgi:hypothetical protein